MPIYRTAIRLVYTPSGGPGVNVWHFRTTTPAGPQSPVLTAAADSLEAFYTSIRALFPTSMYAAYDGQWTRVDGDDYLPPEAGWNVVGTAAGGDGYMPTASALAITWRTEQNSASGRGRTFLSPLSKTLSSTDGTPSAGTLDTVRNAARTLITTWSGEGPGAEGAFGVYSRKDNVIRDFVGVSMTDQFAVLRSRRD